MAYTPAELDALMMNSDVEDSSGCSRCNAPVVVDVVTPTYAEIWESNSLMCKDCIRLLHSFKHVTFAVHFDNGLILEARMQVLKAWLEHQPLPSNQ